MLRSSIILFTALFAFLFLKRKFYRHHLTALVAIVLGIFLVGYSGVVNGSNEASTSVWTSVWGIVILLIGQMAGASGYIIEEKFLGDFDDFDPFLMAGIEGCWAVVIWVILLPILNVIPCSNEDLCQGGYIENSLGALQEYGKQPLHFLWSALVIILMPISYACALSITKYGSASSRTTIESARNVIIWIYFMSVPVNGKRIEEFSAYQLCGFIILLFGVFLYNEIIVLPILGFDRNTQLAIAERERANSANDFMPDRMRKSYRETI